MVKGTNAMLLTGTLFRFIVDEQAIPDLNLTVSLTDPGSAFLNVRCRLSSSRPATAYDIGVQSLLLQVANDFLRHPLYDGHQAPDKTRSISFLHGHGFDTHHRDCHQHVVHGGGTCTRRGHRSPLGVADVVLPDDVLAVNVDVVVVLLAVQGVQFAMVTKMVV